MHKEEWKEIQFNKKYSVSNNGLIKSNGFYANVCGNGKRFVKSKILSFSKNNVGYWKVTLGRNSKTFSVHRLVAECFIPNPDNKEFVNHIDGNKLNNHVSNLEWCTRQENENHAFGTGLKNSTGENNTMSKLTNKDVIEILKSKHIKKKYLAEKYNVHVATIQRILSRKIWKHIII